MDKRKPMTTDASISALKPEEKQYDVADSKVPGLAIRVSPAGRKAWTYRYRNAAGKQQRLGLGTYPAVSLTAARKAARDASGQVSGGLDPVKVKRQSREPGAGQPLETVADLIEAYFRDAERGRHRPNARAKRASTIELERSYYAKRIAPELGKVPIADLMRGQVQGFLDRVGAQSASAARQCLAVLRQSFNYAIRNELATSNPAQLASLPRAEQRERVLTDAEMRMIWQATEEPARARSTTALAIRLAMLTLQRGGEVAGIHADELDRERRLWTLPSDRTKNHRLHIVPLSDAAVAALDAAFGGTIWTGYAFPARKGSALPRLDRGSISKALAKIAKAEGIPDATAHDMRRTGATNLTGERIGIPRFIVSRILNQVSDTGGAAAVTAVYDRHEYQVEKRRGLDAWAALVASIVTGAAMPSNVTTLTTARR